MKILERGVKLSFTFAGMRFYPNIASFILDGLFLLPFSLYLVWLGFVGMAGDESLKAGLGAAFLLHLFLKYLWLITGNRGLRILNMTISIVIVLLLFWGLLFNLRYGEWFENLVMLILLVGVLTNAQFIRSKPVNSGEKEVKDL